MSIVDDQGYVTDLAAYYRMSATAYRERCADKFTGSPGMARMLAEDPIYTPTPTRGRVSLVSPLSLKIEAEARRKAIALRKAQELRNRIDMETVQSELVWLESEQAKRARAFEDAMIEQTSEPQLPQRPKAVDILRNVAAYYRIAFNEIIGPRRNHVCVKPRQEAIALIRGLTILSYPQIGKCVGGRDHTTAIHGTNKHMVSIGFDPAQVHSEQFHEYCRSRYAEIKLANELRLEAAE